jgi:4-hydroxy-3-methylbut-2-enyl diphosphate reductase
MDILLANPRSFCAGVDRAIAIVEQALAKFGTTVYVYHEIVHNNLVVNSLREKGARFISGLDEAPDGAVLVFNAHGVPAGLARDAARRRMHVLNATCPLVNKVHREVLKQRELGKDILLIGQSGHAEVIGTMGQVASGVYLIETADDVERVAIADPDKVARVTQTTLSMDDTAPIVAAIMARFPAATGPKTDDICYASQNRQAAVKVMAAECDLVIVIGSPQSHNTGRLADVAKAAGVMTRQVDSAAEVDPAWLRGVSRVGVTAGASAPPQLVEDVIAALKSHGARAVRELDGPRETVVFPMPGGMLRAASSFAARHIPAALLPQQGVGHGPKL